MSDKKIKTIDEVISDIKKEKSTFYFLVIDSEDKPNATIYYIYNHAKTLQDLGYKVVMLIEGNAGNPNKWLGTDFHTLKIKSATNVNNEVKIKPCDFLMIPEVFASILKSTINMSCKRIVICQNYDFALETLEPGEHWLKDFLIKDVIVTNDNMKNWVEDTFIGTRANVIRYPMNPVFKYTDDLRDPIILVYGRSAKDIVNYSKEFILKYPMYSWIVFKHVSSIEQKDLSELMNTSMGIVWMDKTTSFGTLPLEAMATHLPVIGLRPEMTPEWMTNDNGTWCENRQELVLATKYLVDAFLMDKIDYEKLNNEDYISKYTMDKFKENVENTYNEIIDSRITELTKLKSAGNE